MLFTALWDDDSGFIVSAELVIVATVVVIGMVVGLSEVQHAVVQELNDVGDAIGSVNQSFFFSGFSARKGFGGWGWGIKSSTSGSFFVDVVDQCDWNQCSLACDGVVVREAPKWGSWGAWCAWGY